MGLSDLLIIDKKINEAEKDECIVIINESIKNTHNLLENLLYWARTQSNAIVFSPTWLNIYETVNREVRVLNQIADKKSISIINNINSELKIFADANMFETMIRNIVSNALKYTHPQGIIIIDAQSIKKDNLNFCEISVSDTGVGMSQTVLSNIFNSENTTTTPGTANETGTGLGLLLCKEFMEIHGGNITVTSKTDEGSTFRCLFPMN